MYFDQFERHWESEIKEEKHFKEGKPKKKKGNKVERKGNGSVVSLAQCSFFFSSPLASRRFSPLFPPFPTFPLLLLRLLLLLLLSLFFVQRT